MAMFNTTLGADPTREHRMVAAWSLDCSRLKAEGWTQDALIEGGIAVMSRVKSDMQVWAEIHAADEAAAKRRGLPTFRG